MSSCTSTAVARRSLPAKLAVPSELSTARYPFAASLVLNEDHAEVLLYIFLGATSAQPPAALNIALSLPYSRPLAVKSAINAASASILADRSQQHLLLLEGFKLSQLAGLDLASTANILSHKAIGAAPAARLSPHRDLDLPLSAIDDDATAVAAAAAVLEEGQQQPQHEVAAAAAADVQQRGFLTFAPGFEAADAAAAEALLAAANAGVATHGPRLIDEGEGGTYFVYDASGAAVGVFKPADEDPQADNNPKRRDSLGSGEGAQPAPAQRTRLTIPTHGTAVREVAAAAIDGGYAGVPQTVLVEARHAALAAGEVKVGSLQQFVPNQCASWDASGPAAFSVDDVHRIGIFDIRTFNTDRHGGNLLCKLAPRPRAPSCGSAPRTESYDLVPIDHAYCFPTALGEANWEWLYWPQAKMPFSEAELAYIAAIDIDADAALLARLGLDAAAIRTYRATAAFLQIGAAAGLTLFELGKLAYRGRGNALSALELALDGLLSPLDDDHQQQHDAAAVGEAIEKLCQSQRLYATSTVAIPSHRSTQATLV